MNLDAAGRVIGPEAWSDLFENIKSDCYASRERKVLVFVPATNADSVAAIRILEVISSISVRVLLSCSNTCFHTWGATGGPQSYSSPLLSVPCDKVCTSPGDMRERIDR